MGLGLARSFFGFRGLKIPQDPLAMGLVLVRSFFFGFRGLKTPSLSYGPEPVAGQWPHT